MVGSQCVDRSQIDWYFPNYNSEFLIRNQVGMFHWTWFGRIRTFIKGVWVRTIFTPFPEMSCMREMSWNVMREEWAKHHATKKNVWAKHHAFKKNVWENFMHLRRMYGQNTIHLRRMYGQNIMQLRRMYGQNFIHLRRMYGQNIMH